MNTNDRINEEVQKTLESYSADTVLEPNPYLLTRIMAGRRSRIASRGSLLFAGWRFNRILIALLLSLNLITVVYFFESTARRTQQEELVTELVKEFEIDLSQTSF